MAGDTLEAQLKALMLAGLAGDAAAQRRLLMVTAERLRQFFARRLGPDTAEIEDLVQDTLIAIHQRRASYDPRLPFTAWLHAIAKYKLVDHLRRSYRARLVALDDIAEPVAEDAFGPALAAQDVERLLAALPLRHREAIHLTRIEGLSVAEAAERTGQSQSAIKTGVHRGLRRLIARISGSH